MSISGIGSAGAIDLSTIASNVASKMVKNLDINGDGSIDKKEFVTGLTAKGISADVAAKQFDSLDTKKTGKITQSDIESAIKGSGGKGSPPSGARSAGGQAPGGTGQAGGASATGGSKTYDKMDLNQDGTVTSMEELVYELKHSVAAVSDNKTSTQKLGNNVNLTV